MKCFIIDGHVKCSHHCCAVMRSLPYADFESIHEIPHIPIGCREAVMMGLFFCQKHYEMITPNLSDGPATAPSPSKKKKKKKTRKKKGTAPSSPPTVRLLTHPT